MTSKTLSAGFTGDVADPGTVSARARAAVDRAKDEATLVATHAGDHPAATGSVVAVVALAAFALGYLLGASSPGRRRLL